VLLIDRTVLEQPESNETPPASVSTLVQQFEAEGLDRRAALKKAARELGLSRAEAYRRLTRENH